MAAVAEPLLMTVEQYRELPQREDVVQELHWGQVITLTRPKMGHSKLQYRLVELLRSRFGNKGIVASEVPFRALPQYELRGADVAFVLQTAGCPRRTMTICKVHRKWSSKCCLVRTPKQKCGKRLHSVFRPAARSSGSSIPSDEKSLLCAAKVIRLFTTSAT